MLKTKKGFTLIELVVVMAIIAILSVIIVGAILAARTAATNTQRTGAVRTLETALEARAARCNGMYYADQSATKGATCAALTSTNVDTIIADLKTRGFLTQDVTIDTAGKVTFVASGTNNYVIAAFDNSSPQAEIYSARR